MNSDRWLVIIPTYNERSNIKTLIPAVLAQDTALDVLVVDDSSPDGTGACVEQLSAGESRIFLVSQPEKLGLGRAYQKGFHYVINEGYRYALTMDADLSHNPDDIPRLLQAMESADYAIGSRWVPGGALLNWPWHRIMLSRFANWYIYLLHGTGIHDSTSGFQCLRREVIETILIDRIQSSGYSFQLEVKYRAFQMGFRLLEVPIVFQDRTRGVSKIPRRTILDTFWCTLILRLQKRRLRSRHPRRG